MLHTVYPKKYAHGFCFAVLCCGYTLTDFPISIRLTSLALWQSNDCPSASKATLMNMDKYFMWIHYERLHNHNKAKHNKTVCIFLGIYCSLVCICHSQQHEKDFDTDAILALADLISPANVFFKEYIEVSYRWPPMAIAGAPRAISVQKGSIEKWFQWDFVTM